MPPPLPPLPPPHPDMIEDEQSAVPLYEPVKFDPPPPLAPPTT
jgi:hypothetical protein